MHRLNQQRSFRAAADAFLVLMFSALLILPSVDSVFRLDHATGFNEKRVPTSFPKYENHWRALPEFCKGFEAYFNDHFGFRRRLIHWHHLCKVNLFKTGGSKQVIVGRNGWLYYSETGTRADDHFLGAVPFSTQELDDFKRLLEGRRDWLARRGCRYLFVVAPDKQSVYPENMPAWLEPIRTPTRLDQLIAFMSSNSTVKILDLREPLREARQIAPTYYKTDTHWNHFGALVGCQEMVKALASEVPSLKAVSLASFDLNIQQVKGGDLAEMLGVYGEDQEVLLSPHANLPILVESVLDPNFVRPKYFTTNPAGEDTVIVFCDSFGAAMRPLLGYHFQKVGYFWPASDFETQVVEQYHPTIVISEIVERHFNVTDLAARLRAMPPADDRLYK